MFHYACPLNQDTTYLYAVFIDDRVFYSVLDKRSTAVIIVIILEFRTHI